nr:replication factor C subunit 2 [Tanacetum cinerariifolium]
ALATLSSISQGDLRRAITFLRVIPHEVVQALLTACKSGSFDSANKEVNNVIAKGYQIFDMVVESEDVTDEQKARIFKKLGEPDKVSDILIYFYFAFLWFVRDGYGFKKR